MLKFEKSPKGDQHIQAMNKHTTTIEQAMVEKGLIFQIQFLCVYCQMMKEGDYELVIQRMDV